MSVETVCNMCGKPFDVLDRNQNFCFHRPIRYGSRFDMDELDLDLCCDCFDKIMVKYIIPNCKYSPILMDDNDDDLPDDLFDDEEDFDDEPEDADDFFDMLYEEYRHRFDVN